MRKVCLKNIKIYSLLVVSVKGRFNIGLLVWNSIEDGQVEIKLENPWFLLIPVVWGQT